MKDLIKTYNELYYEKDMQEYKSDVIPTIESFKKDFPIEKINDLTLEEYVISAKGKGSQNTFCGRLLDNDMDRLASSANFHNNSFEVFNQSVKGITTYGKIAKKYNYNINETFEVTKNAIVQLLADPSISSFQKTQLNSGFAARFLFVYFSDKFIPASIKMLEDYYKPFNIKQPGKTWIQNNKYLQDVIKHNLEGQEWNTFIMMRFCDWLVRSQGIV